MLSPSDRVEFLSKVERRIRDAVLGKPLIGNTLRGLFVEALIAEVLSPDWGWVAADWSSWDFEHLKNQCAVEVKQSAARQPWSHLYDHKAKPRFDIAPRTGYWVDREGTGQVTWVDEIGRAADIYVFAWHGEDGAHADHRDPGQWDFYVVFATDLPKQKSIGLFGVIALGERCKITTLAQVLERCSVQD